MSTAKGRTLRYSAARRIVADIMYFSVGRPLIPIERVMHLGALIEARNQLHGARPGWCAIFVKAYALLSTRVPELRRAYLPYPWERLYESNEPIATIAIERELQGEQAVLPGVLKNPHALSLMEIEGFLLQCKSAPTSQIKSMKRTLRTLTWPRWMRRLLWSWVLNAWGSKRASEFGTFGVSVTAGMGAATLALLSPLTTTLHYGLLTSDDSLPVRVTFDHRVLDAGVMSRALVQLEAILHGEILTELRMLASPPARAA